jgi:hypothetical protein
MKEVSFEGNLRGKGDEEASCYTAGTADKPRREGSEADPDPDPGSSSHSLFHWNSLHFPPLFSTITYSTSQPN